MNTIILILILLQIKHWYIDFVDQTEEEVKHKGIYLDWLGLKHSLKHALATFIIFFIFISIEGAVIVALIDLIIHYHTDWIKMKFGNRDIKTKQFWAQLGLDQMVHQFTYIGLVSLLIV